ncbi:MAG: DUF4272 domain-containing protein [Bacilli bacterium]|nr:DUF4272 domain-containing protein [Bacilli bacterium]
MEKEGNNQVVIMSEDAFDESKFILDDKDKKRIDKNIQFLREKNLPYLEDMHLIPINAICNIKEKNEVLDKLLSAYTVYILACYSLDNMDQLVHPTLNKLDEKYNIRRLLNDEDILTIDRILDGRLLFSELKDCKLKLEECYIYLWVLGFCDRQSPRTFKDDKLIKKIINKHNNYQQLLSNCYMRTDEEIMEYADLIARLKYSCRNLKKENKSSNYLTESIVEKQSIAFDYVTSYNFNKLIKQTINCKCEKNNLKFSFVIPSSLTYCKISKKSKELFALTSEDYKTRIVVLDLGESSKYQFEFNCKEYTKKFEKNGFEIVNKSTFTSNNLNENIYHIVIKKDDLVINSYMFIVCNRFIRLDSLVNSKVNYMEYNELINAKNTNIDLDLIFSIKEYSDREENIRNEHEFTNKVVNSYSIGVLSNYCESIYKAFLDLSNHDEKINKDKSYDKRDYHYKKDDVSFEIYAIDKSLNHYSFETYNAYINSINAGNLDDVNSLSLKLNLSYSKGKNGNLDNYINEYEIIFKQYSIKTVRVSNHVDESMDQVEEAINNIIEKLPEEKNEI